MPVRTQATSAVVRPDARSSGHMGAFRADCRRPPPLSEVFVRSSRVRIAVPVAATAAFGLAAVIPGVPAQAVSTTLVVSEAYGGGGNSGATLKNDFVERQNVTG